jgi:hypothetical protein
MSALFTSIVKELLQLRSLQKVRAVTNNCSRKWLNCQGFTGIIGLLIQNQSETMGYVPTLILRGATTDRSVITNRNSRSVCQLRRAGVAKLADASALGADGGNPMEVRFLSPAPVL